MYAGIETLRSNDNAYHAFLLANRAMYMQRIHIAMQSEMAQANADRYPGDEEISDRLNGMLPWDGRIGAFFGIGSDNRTPELIIQDELHLISGALGTVVGLYETAVDGQATVGPPARSATRSKPRADISAENPRNPINARRAPPM